MKSTTRHFDGLTVIGRIASVQGTSIGAYIPQASVGDLCEVECRGGALIPGQIVSFKEDLFSLALFEEAQGISPGSMVRTWGQPLTIPVGNSILGTVINPLGKALASHHICGSLTKRSIYSRPPPVVGRPPISEPIATGIRSIDGFCTLGKGQRAGIFAPAGIGKSTLLASIARQTSADVIVVALVGERGREVQEFIEDTLGADGLARSVIVVATSDDSSLMRQTAPYTATSIAEFFRENGKDVLLIVDSLTRLARAIRETSISAGDLPIRHGYTNSVYTQLPKLVERAGRSDAGSITALYTVLTSQEDDIDPLADEIKSLLDGHIVLRKEMAELGIVPAVDITHSISRLFSRLRSRSMYNATQVISRALARLIKERHILLLGGAPDEELKRILEHQRRLFDLISQPTHGGDPCNDLDRQIREVASLLSGE
jgi:flagellum-specific ATP synthase